MGDEVIVEYRQPLTVNQRPPSSLTKWFRGIVPWEAGSTHVDLETAAIATST